MRSSRFLYSNRYLPHRSRRPWHLTVLLFAIALLPRCSAAEQAHPIKEVRRVLVFYEASLSYPGIAKIDRDIRVAFEESPYQIEFYSETLEEMMLPSEASQMEMFREYIRKYRDHKPDLIIAEGPAVIKFMVNSHDRFFVGIPVVFCCATEEQVGQTRFGPDFTGSWISFEPKKTIDTALQLQPATQHLIIVGGTSNFDKGVEAMVRAGLQDYESGFDVQYLTNLTMPALLDQLSGLPNNSIILFTSLSQDAAGTLFVGPTQSLPLIIQAANAPVFVVSDSQIGKGTIGGYLVSLDSQGRIAGETGLEILRGKKPQEIPIVRGLNFYMFDWRAMRRWKLNANGVPPGSVIVNRELTLWETHKPYVIAGIGICLAEMLLIFGLLWQRARRKKTAELLVERLTFEALISELSTKLITLPEEELDVHIEEELSRVGEFLDLQRITLREFSNGEKHLATCFSWNVDGLRRPPAVVNAEEFPWWTERVRRGEVCLISEVDELPSDAVAEKGYLARENIVSAAAIPLLVGDAIIGVISFVSTQRRVTWTEGLVKQLRVLAEIFSNALRRKYAMQVLRANLAELRVTQAVLRESEERFRLVANNAPVLIWMSGPDKLCTYFNDTWLDFTGRLLDQELGNGWSEDVHRDDIRNCLETYVQAFDRREEFTMEYRLRRTDGQYRWVQDRGVPRFNSDGSFAGYIGSCIDVTDRKLATEALSSLGGRLIEALEQERMRIARELHDDINQRLAVLAIELDALKNVSVPPADLRGRVDHLLKSTSDISVDIQGLSHRLHSSKLEYLGIVPAMRGFCGEFATQHKVEIDFTSSNVPDRLDREISLCLFRILQEALNNAVKYSGVRHFEARLNGMGSELQLVVRDSGRGFDVGVAQGGRGLGLISMRERVSLVKGTISLESKPMQGTHIEVHIPFASQFKQATAI